MSETDPLPESFLGALDPVPEDHGAKVVDWTVTQDPELEVAFDELTDWVHWLAGTYVLDARFVPDCWMKHDSLLWELSTLHTAWLGAFRTKELEDGDDRGVSWHEQFALARQRLKDWTGRTGCRTSGHRS